MNPVSEWKVSKDDLFGLAYCLYILGDLPKFLEWCESTLGFSRTLWRKYPDPFLYYLSMSKNQNDFVGLYEEHVEVVTDQEIYEIEGRCDEFFDDPQDKQEKWRKKSLEKLHEILKDRGVTWTGEKMQVKDLLPQDTKYPIRILMVLEESVPLQYETTEDGSIRVTEYEKFTKRLRDILESPNHPKRQKAVEILEEINKL